MASRSPRMGHRGEPVVIYVSGASAEIERAEAFIAEARRRGVVVTVDWPRFFRREEAGEAIPRFEVVQTDVRGVMDADTLVVLLPTDGRSSRGLWVEVGVAIAEGTQIVWVGRERDADIWGCLGTFVATDAEALALVERAERGLEGLRE